MCETAGNSTKKSHQTLPATTFALLFNIPDTLIIHSLFVVPGLSDTNVTSGVLRKILNRILPREKIMTKLEGFCWCSFLRRRQCGRSRSRQIFAVQSPTRAAQSCRTPLLPRRQAETGLTRTSTSDSAGSFLILELPVGHYQIEVSAKGFRKYLQEGISLNVNETASVPVHLAVGPEGEKVQVEADAELIQPTVTSLGQAVLEREIVDLPLNGRNFSQLGTLQPGVMPLTAGLAEAGGSLRAGQPYAVNGQRPESNNFLIDGANNFNGVDGGFVLEPPIDAIEEFRIITHNSNPEFGTSLGSTTNIITRSGSNNFHGALWEFLRNDAFDSTGYLASSKEPLKQNQFGGSIGGPIRHDKTFFYGFYEGVRNRQGESVGSTVPSLAERGGDLVPYAQVMNGHLDSHHWPLLRFEQPVPSKRSVVQRLPWAALSVQSDARAEPQRSFEHEPVLTQSVERVSET